MLLNVRVYPNSAGLKFEFDGERRLLSVHLTAPAERNKANVQLIKELARKLEIGPESIRIKTGKSSKNKVLEIGLEERDLEEIGWI